MSDVINGQAQPVDKLNFYNNTLVSGTYTPTLTNTTNVAASLLLMHVNG